MVLLSISYHVNQCAFQFCLLGIEKKPQKYMYSKHAALNTEECVFITAPALDCGRMLWDMGSRNKVKILKGMTILNFTYHFCTELAHSFSQLVN